MLFASLGQSVLGETVPSCLEYSPRAAASGRTRDLGQSFSQCVVPENIHTPPPPCREFQVSPPLPRISNF